MDLERARSGAARLRHVGRDERVYVSREFIGGGVGTALYRHLFRVLDREDVHRAYAVMSLPNEPSIALHERFGFVRAGFFSEQGRKFGRYWDVAWYEKRMPSD